MSLPQPVAQAPSTGPMTTWHAALAEGRLDIQRCANCSRHVFYPRLVCPHCSGASLEWVAATGTGTVYSTTIVARRAEHGGPYNVALVDLDEGVRMMSRVEDIGPAQVVIGQRVRAFIGQIDGQPAVLFKPQP